MDPLEALISRKLGIAVPEPEAIDAPEAALEAGEAAPAPRVDIGQGQRGSSMFTRELTPQEQLAKDIDDVLNPPSQHPLQKPRKPQWTDVTHDRYDKSNNILGW